MTRLYLRENEQYKEIVNFINYLNNPLSVFSAYKDIHKVTVYNHNRLNDVIKKFTTGNLKEWYFTLRDKHVMRLIGLTQRGDDLDYVMNNYGISDKETYRKYLMYTYGVSFTELRKGKQPKITFPNIIIRKDLN